MDQLGDEGVQAAMSEPAGEVRSDATTEAARGMDLAIHLKRVEDRYAEDVKEPSRKPAELHAHPDIGLSRYARRRLVGIMAQDPDRFTGSSKAVAGEGKASPRREAVKDEEAVNWLIGRDTPISKTITLEKFQTLRFRGKHAVRSFRRWLDEGVEPLENFRDLLPPKAFHEDVPGRQDVVEKAHKFLATTTLKPILVVEGDGMSEGLRAFAGHLIDGMDENDHRPICYLPVSRDPVTGDKISYAKLVGYLAAFYERKIAAEAVMPQTAADLRSMLEVIRKQMSLQPAIFILDGWAGFHGALRRLGSLIIDDGLSSLLDEIVHPFRGADASGGDPGLFYRNRIIVLAAAPVFKNNPFVHASLALAAPDLEQLASIVRDQGRPDEMVGLVETALELQRREPGRTAPKRTDVALALQHFLVDRTLAAGTFQAERSKLLANEEDLADQTIDALKATPLAMLVVVIAALMPDGVRLSTLSRLIGVWLDALALAPPVAFRIDQSDETVAGALKILKPLLSQGSDERIFGLDAVVAVGDAKSRPRGDLADGGRDYLDFVAPRLKSLLVQRLILRKELHGDIARLHRLLAEEALAQHNIVSRHGDWRDANDIRYYRRLFQALYHGFSSLAEGPGKAADKGLDALPSRALPKDPTTAYQRLYAVLYRALLEAPPEWLLSRSLGRDDVKVDLLLLAMNLSEGEPWRLISGEGQLQPRGCKFLGVKHAEPWTGAVSIALDQYASLAKAAGRNNEIGIAKKAVTAGLGLLTSVAGRLGEAGGLEWTPALRAYLSLSKIKIDLELVQRPWTELDDLRIDAVDLMRQFQFPEPWLEPFERASETIAFTAASFEAMTDATLSAFSAGLKGRTDCETLSAWADLIGLVAEIDIIKAEQAEKTTDAERFRDLTRAYLYLCASDRLHRAAFEVSPLSRDFYVNPHATRVLIRVVLQLVQRIKASGLAGPQAKAFLANQARRQLDLLTRYVARFPTERPSLLILESTFIRLTGDNPAADLAGCEQILSEADNLMVAATHRPRVRLRLMRERTKVYAALATARRAEKSAAQTYMDLAFLEIARLKISAEKAQLTLWMATAEKQRNKLLGLVAGGLPGPSFGLPPLDA